MKIKYLIIGTSAAGLSAAVKIRSLDNTGNITCLTGEAEMPYNRCLLADYLAGSKTEEQIAIKSQEFFDEHAITLVRNAYVKKINPEEYIVITHDNRMFEYEKLFIGTGRSGWIPDLPGAKLEGVFSFYGLADTQAILNYQALHTVKHAIVIGAGLSGLECADSLSKQGLSIDIIERSQRVLPSQFDEDGSSFLISLMRKKNVTVHTSNEVKNITGENNHATGVELNTGKRLMGSMIIFAIGGKINNSLARSAGLSMHNNGILVNDRMQTSNPNIFVGGDVCVVPDILTKELIQSCLWPDATQQGMTAGSVMAGHDRSYPGSLIVTSSHIYGTTFVTAGPVSSPPTHYSRIIRSGEDFYHVYLLDNDHLKGFALIGKVNNVGILRKALMNDLPFNIP